VHRVKWRSRQRVRIMVEKNAAKKGSPLHRWESDEAVDGF
jgi:hypothetical protein